MNTTMKVQNQAGLTLPYLLHGKRSCADSSPCGNGERTVAFMYDCTYQFINEPTIFAESKQILSVLESVFRKASCLLAIMHGWCCRVLPLQIREELLGITNNGRKRHTMFIKLGADSIGPRIQVVGKYNALYDMVMVLRRLAAIISSI